MCVTQSEKKADKMFGWTFRISILLVVYISFNLSVCAFDDTISVLGRIRWNYTSYEENLWTREFKNTTLEQIYQDHDAFINAINSIYNANDSFYPTINASADSAINTPIVYTIVNNPYRVPEIGEVIQANAQVNEFWSKFSNWTTFNTSNMLDVLTDDAIPALQNSLDVMWNSTFTVVYFNFLKNVRHISISRVELRQTDNYSM